MKYSIILTLILLLYGPNRVSIRYYLAVSLIIVKNISRYKYERVQAIGPACGGLFNWYVGIFPTSTYIWFNNQAVPAIIRTSLDVTNQPVVYECSDSSASLFGAASPVFRSQFLHSIEVHRCMDLYR